MRSSNIVVHIQHVYNLHMLYLSYDLRSLNLIVKLYDHAVTQKQENSSTPTYGELA